MMRDFRRWATNCRRWAAAVLRYDIALAFIVAAAVILLTVGLGYESNKLIPANPSTSSHYQAEPGNKLEFLAQWDSSTYLRLAQHGYRHVSETNFFPLYPALIRVVHLVVRSPLVSALIVSWSCFVGVVYFYLKVVRELYPKALTTERLRASLLLVLFPTAIFFVAAYTESLFCFLALGAIYCALRKNWLGSALFAAFATATHLNGLFVVLLCAVMLWEAKERLLKIGAMMVVGSLGFVAYLTYLLITFHTPLAFLGAQANHSTAHINPVQIVGDLLTRNGIFFVLLAVATIYYWRRRLSFALYTLLYICIVFEGAHGMSGFGRYSLAAFPVPLMLYDVFRNKQLGFAVVIALSAIGWAYFTMLYAAGYTGG